MSAHEGHDHPATKAGRAACRRAGNNHTAVKSQNAGAKAEAKPRAKRKVDTSRPVTAPIHTSLPHAYDEDAERPGRCYVCKLTVRARVHDDH